MIRGPGWVPSRTLNYMTSNHKKSSSSLKATAASDPDLPSERDRSRPRVVGVGASAGGLEAFTRLLKRLPTTTGLGFVLVQHLNPNYKSALTQILSRATAMPVCEVTNNLRVDADHVYVIPPNTSLRVAHGVLKLKSRTSSRTIDPFLESLARDQRGRAVGVLLSGLATDGTLGLKAIKAGDGITFAQDESAEHTSMACNAIRAGWVDFVLSPEGIAEELTRLAKHP